MEKDLSIIVPVFNMEKYLEKCLSSIASQNYLNMEIICVNDGSTDSSLKILKKFAAVDNRFVIIDKKNTGYGNTLNIGIQKALGEYIGIVESDDFIVSDIFIKLISIAKKLDIDVLKGNYNFYYENEKAQFKYNEILKGCPYDEIINSMKYENLFEISPSVWSAIYKKDFLINNNIKFLETPGASYQDISFTFKVFLYAKRVYLLKDAIINYRFDNADSSVYNPEKIFCVCNEFEEIESHLENECAELREKIFGIVKHMKFRTYLWNYNRLASPYQYAFLLKFSSEFQDLLKTESNKSSFQVDEWECLHRIGDEPDQYFKQTCRDFYDPRMQLINIWNNKFDFLGLKKCIKIYDEIYIYGAGKIGKEVYEYFKKIDKKEKIKGFIVSSLTENVRQIESKKVYEISEIINLKYNGLLIIAIEQKKQYEIVKKLYDLNLKNVLLVTYEMRKFIREESMD